MIAYAGWSVIRRQVHAVLQGDSTALCGQTVDEIVGGKSPLPFLAVPTTERCAWCHYRIRG